MSEKKLPIDFAEPEPKEDISIIDQLTVEVLK